MRSSSLLETGFFAGPELGGEPAGRFLPPDSLSLVDSFLLATVVDTAAAKPALDLTFNLGRAAALRSRAWRARRAPELPDEDDE